MSTWQFITVLSHFVVFHIYHTQHHSSICILYRTNCTHFIHEFYWCKFVNKLTYSKAFGTSREHLYVLLQNTRTIFQEGTKRWRKVKRTWFRILQNVQVQMYHRGHHVVVAVALPCIKTCGTGQHWNDYWWYLLYADSSRRPIETWNLIYGGRVEPR